MIRYKNSDADGPNYAHLTMELCVGRLYVQVLSRRVDPITDEYQMNDGSDPRDSSNTVVLTPIQMLHIRDALNAALGSIQEPVGPTLIEGDVF